VGYPDRLRPMLDEYHGSPVAGGTYPAQIFKTFMEKALPRLGDEPESFPSPSYPYASPRNIVFRNGRWRADNGYCRGTREVLYFYGRGPDTTADCKPNEVEVPRVTGLKYADAVTRLGLQPLEAEAVYKPAVPRQRVGYVLGQLPRVGARLSAYDTVKLVVAKPLHGVVPRVVGLQFEKARRRLDRLELRPVVRRQKAKGRPGRVLSQEPLPGVAAAPHMPVTLVVAAPAG
jgi:membrane peptidoglycan carboxypeptidase